MPRRSRSERGLVTSSTSGLAFPDRLSTTLSYADNARTSSATSFSNIVWSLNSVFDPDVSGAGHQPRFFDQYAAIYARYLVTRVDMRLVVRQRAAHGLGVVLVPTNGAPALSPALYPAEFRRATPPMITSSNQPPVEIVKSFSPHAIAGVTEQIYKADDRFQAGVASNPLEVINANAYVYNLDGTTALDCEWSIELKYHVLFFDLAVPGPSLAAASDHVVVSAPADAPPTSSGSVQSRALTPATARTWFY